MKLKTVHFIGKKYIKNTSIKINPNKNTRTPKPDT